MAAAWTLEEGKEFLDSIRPLLVRTGYTGRIIGSVKLHGNSNKDLDILLTPISEEFDIDIEKVALDKRWKVIDADANYEMFTVKLERTDKIVDFWVGVLEESMAYGFTSHLSPLKKPLTWADKVKRMYKRKKKKEPKRLTEDKLSPGVEIDEWMEPDCERHTLAVGETHQAWADEYFDDGSFEPDSGEAALSLLNMGWLRIVRFPGKIYFHGSANHKQRSLLKDLAFEEKRELINGNTDRVVYSPGVIRKRNVIIAKPLPYRPPGISTVQYNFMRGESVENPSWLTNFDGWMDSAAMFHGIGISKTHNEWAYEFLNDEKHPITQKDMDGAGATLFDRGWLKIRRFSGDPQGSLHFFGNTPSLSQRKELKNWAVEENRVVIDDNNDTLFFNPSDTTPNVNSFKQKSWMNIKPARPEGMSTVQYNFMRGESVENYPTDDVLAWLLPDCQFIWLTGEIDNHGAWIIENALPEDLHKKAWDELKSADDDPGYDPMETLIWAIDWALDHGHVRVIKEIDDKRITFDGKPTQKQLKELKDLAIENGYELHGGLGWDCQNIPLTNKHLASRPTKKPPGMTTAEFNFMRGESVVTEDLKAFAKGVDKDFKRNKRLYLREFQRLAPNLQITDIALAGSYAKGRMSEKSDIDVAVYYKANVNPNDVAELLAGKVHGFGGAFDVTPFQESKQMKKKNEGTWVFVKQVRDFNRSTGKEVYYVIQRREEDGATRKVYDTPRGRQKVRYETFKQFVEDMTDATCFGPPSTPYADGDARIPFMLGAIQRRPFMKKKKRKKRNKIPYGALTRESRDLSSPFPPASEDPPPGRNYFYHLTRPQSIPGIREKGLIGGRNVISVAPHLAAVYYYADAIVDPTRLLRIERRDVRPGHTEDYYAMTDTAELWLNDKVVPPEHIEIYDDNDGTWKPLV